MHYLEKRVGGTPLISIIEQLGNKAYEKIICRCKYIDSRGDLNDDITSSCTYDAKTGLKSTINKVTLEDTFNDWKESEINGAPVLTVWYNGMLMKS